MEASDSSMTTHDSAHINHGTRPAIIEVYPALAKVKGEQVCRPALQRLLPDDAVAGSDECDAAICALLAVAFGLDGESNLLPRLISPDASVSNEELRSEGWIYYPSPA
jgi:predicted nuclease with RNAse H fold